MKPFVKEYNIGKELKRDAKLLQDNGIKSEDIYVLAHDDDRTNRLAESAGINRISFSEMKLTDVVDDLFLKKGDELRAKLKEIGISEGEAHKLEGKLDDGKVLLVIADSTNVAELLG